jgi:hypothetical protein
MDFVWVTNDVGDITAVTAGTGISGGGTSGAVTITNSMATEITAKGDLIAGTGSATFDNLPVGTNGQTLVADSTASTGLKWATPATASSGMTFISRTTFSNVATAPIDSPFTSSYYNYLVVIEEIYAGTGGDDLQLQMRYGGNTTEAGGSWNGNCITTTRANTTTTNTASNQQVQFTISMDSGSSATRSGAYQMTFSGVGNTTEVAKVAGYGNVGADTYGFATFGAGNHSQRIYTGFLLKSSSSNITGTVSVYGLAKA